LEQIEHSEAANNFSEHKGDFSMKKHLLFSVFTASLILGATCTKSPTGPSGNIAVHTTWPKLSIASAISVTKRIKVEVLADDSLRTGYNALAVVLRDSLGAQILTNAHVMWYPLMNMGMMQHSSPVDEISDDPGDDSLFRAGILFIMASMSSIDSGRGGWTLRTIIHDHRTDTYDSADIPIWVNNATPSRILTWTGPDSLVRKAALVKPTSPVSDTQTFDLFVSKEVGLFTWPADTGWQVTFVTTMPSMGHSSPNNVQPVSTGNGHYQGKVNFTMSGDWRLTFTLKPIGDTVTTSQYLDLTVQ